MLAVGVEVIGWLGAASLLAAYGLLSTGRIAAGKLYQLLNLAGSLGLALNAVVHRALPSAALNVIWLVVGVIALQRLAERRTDLRRADVS